MQRVFVFLSYKGSSKKSSPTSSGSLVILLLAFLVFSQPPFLPGPSVLALFSTAVSPESLDVAVADFTSLSSIHPAVAKEGYDVSVLSLSGRQDTYLAHPRQTI